MDITDYRISNINAANWRETELQIIGDDAIRDAYQIAILEPTEGMSDADLMRTYLGNQDKNKPSYGKDQVIHQRTMIALAQTINKGRSLPKYDPSKVMVTDDDIIEAFQENYPAFFREYGHK